MRAWTRTGSARQKGGVILADLKLANGALSFSAHGLGLDDNARGPVVLCLHGFPDNARSFRFQLPALAAAGYRAVAPTLRGYEPSSQPADGDYSLEALGRDVLAWVDGLAEKKVHLIGHDWGAAVAYVAGALAPERFHSLTTIAVPPAAHDRAGAYARDHGGRRRLHRHTAL